jgi:hypothetical protein
MGHRLRDTTALTSWTFLPTDQDGKYNVHGRPAEIRLHDGLQRALLDAGITRAEGEHGQKVEGGRNGGRQVGVARRHLYLRLTGSVADVGSHEFRFTWAWRPMMPGHLHAIAGATITRTLAVRNRFALPPVAHADLSATKDGR